MADLIDVKLLINQYDRESSISVELLSRDLTIKDLKCKLFNSDIIRDCNVRVIHCGKILNDTCTLNKLINKDESLVLSIFITKPNKTLYNEHRDSNTNIWKWSTTIWLLIMVTFWCYKFKSMESIKNFSVLILYITTFFCCHTVFARFIINTGSNRTN